jgi:hypothetical protein
LLEVFSLLGILLGTVTLIGGIIWLYAVKRTDFHIGYFTVLIVYSYIIGLSLEVLFKGLALVVLSVFKKAEIIATSTIIGNPDPVIIKAVIIIGALTGIAIVVFFTWDFFKWMIAKSKKGAQ